MSEALAKAVAAAIAPLVEHLDRLQVAVEALRDYEVNRMAQLAYLARCNAARHFNGHLQ